MVAVVSLLPKLERSGGGGMGCPVMVCCSLVLDDNDRDCKLDNDWLSSFFVPGDAGGWAADEEENDDDECDEEGGGREASRSKSGEAEERLLKVFELDETGEWFAERDKVALKGICDGWRIDLQRRFEGLRPFLRSLDNGTMKRDNEQKIEPYFNGERSLVMLLVVVGVGFKSILMSLSVDVDE